MPSPTPMTSTPDGTAIRVKVVPGASRSKVVGMLGDRLKVAVAAPPEGGKANDAVCRLLAEFFGVPPRNVIVAEGHSRPQKTVTLIGLSLCAATERLTQWNESHAASQ